MIVHDLRPQEMKHPVKKLCRVALKKRVLLSGRPHAIDNIISRFIGIDHVVHRIHIVLQIRIHGDDHIRMFHRHRNPCQKRILMSAVPG